MRLEPLLRGLTRGLGLGPRLRAPLRTRPVHGVLVARETLLQIGGLGVALAHDAASGRWAVRLRNGDVKQVTTMTSRLSSDRRVVDEPTAAAFLQAFAHYVAHPELLSV